MGNFDGLDHQELFRLGNVAYERSKLYRNSRGINAKPMSKEWEAYARNCFRLGQQRMKDDH